MKKEQMKGYSEETSGVMVALFAVIAIFLAVLVCVTVTVLTVGDLPIIDHKPSESTANGTTDQQPPEFDSTPVFSSSSVFVRPYSTEQTAAASVQSGYAVLVDAESGEILAGKNSGQRIDPASMTKVMTLIVACERLKQGDLTRDVTFTDDIQNFVRPASGGYKGSACHWSDVGDGASLLDQLYGIAVESAADCSVMVACYIVGKSAAESEAQFVVWMNETAAQMGLTNTHFDNIIGYQSEGNYSTAEDMAAIMIRALQCPLIVELLSTPTRTSTAFGYRKDGTFNPAFPSYFYSTLFNANPQKSSRIKSYEERYGTFKLESLVFGGGKTGSLEQGSNSWTYSLVSFAKDANGKYYVAVTAEVTASHGVMSDAKLLYDTYAK